jgi:hypothetical protein
MALFFDKNVLSIYTSESLGEVRGFLLRLYGEVRCVHYAVTQLIVQLPSV